ncbi:MAG: hypothetical protein JSU87_01300 [Gemmatimonadota bacterium]|nr:MAG: hypothetical protein JSU87_01300 [Gemmatimonadota bacterium]
MGPEEAAQLLAEEIEECLAELAGATAAPGVEIQPPRELRADRSFWLSVYPGIGAAFEFELPVNLALGYLADEEAAVDEWRLWLHTLWQRVVGSDRQAG